MPQNIASPEQPGMGRRDGSGSKILQMMQKHNQMHQIPAPVDEDQDDLFNAINKVDHSAYEYEDQEQAYDQIDKNIGKGTSDPNAKNKPEGQTTLFDSGTQGNQR